MDEVQALIERIRRNVVAEAEQKFADETFKHLRHSLYNCRMRDADGIACLTGEGGESMELYLKFRDNRVADASYITDGSSSSCLCGSCTAELAIGKTTEELLEIQASEVINRVGRSGGGIEKCALLAVTALHQAVENHWLKKGNRISKTKFRKTRFIAVGKGSSHMQYSN